MQILLHSLDRPPRMLAFQQHNRVTHSNPPLFQDPIVPTRATQLPSLRRESFDPEPMIEFKTRLAGKRNLKNYIWTDAYSVTNADVPFIHVFRDEVLAEAPKVETPIVLRKFTAPVWIMAWVVLVDCFVDAAMEGEIVFVVFEACEAAEDACGAGLFVNSCVDVEIVHRFHFGGAELNKFIFEKRCVEVDGCHG